MGPGNLAKLGLKNPDRQMCRELLYRLSHRSTKYLYSSYKKMQCIFFAIIFWIQEQNVEKQEAVPSLLSPMYNVLIRCWNDNHKTKYHR